MFHTFRIPKILSLRQLSNKEKKEIVSGEKLKKRYPEVEFYSDPLKNIISIKRKLFIQKYKRIKIFLN